MYKFFHNLLSGNLIVLKNAEMWLGNFEDFLKWMYGQCYDS